MAQATAGELADFLIDGQLVTAKVEDASKSESILAKVAASESPMYKEGQVYEFERKWLREG